MLFTMPARFCVAVKALPQNVLCEVELIAAIETVLLDRREIDRSKQGQV